MKDSAHRFIHLIVLSLAIVFFASSVPLFTHAAKRSVKSDSSANPTSQPTPPLNGKIAFTHFNCCSQPEQIATIDEDGSNLTTLTNVFTHAEDPAFSPDGSQIAFSMVSGGSFQIWLMNADGGNQHRVTNSARNDYNPAWSPDGSKIAFAGNNQIYVINSDGTNEVQLSDGTTPDDFPTWSPDGSKIAFTKNVSSGNAQIYVMNADGTGLTNLSNSFFADRDPKWSPDGTKIAYHSFAPGHYEVFVMNADGSNQTRITNTSFGVDNTGPSWSPDGSKIAFSSTRDGDQGEIYVMDADGNNQTRVTNDPAQDDRPSWGQPPAGNTPTGTNVTVPQGLVQLTFASVTAGGNTTATPIDPNSAGTLPGQYVLSGESMAFEITTTATSTAPITVCIIDSAAIDEATFDTLRILHGESGVLVDRTILPPDAPAPDFNTKTICARVDSLSPFVIAKLTPLYAVAALFDQTKPVKSGSTLPVKLQLTNSGGANVSSSSIVVTALNVVRISTNTASQVQDSGNANPDNNFRFSGGSYIFNLSTKGYATGTYLLRFKAGADPTVHTVQFQVK
jgi:Tol biopolymer transport system component